MRALRIARGLSQADVAGTDFSKGFISLVETGRTRMSLRAADILAGRLGISTSELVGPASAPAQQEIELLALRADQQLGSGRPDLALQAADSAMRAASGLMKVKLTRVRGRALTELGRPREAIPVLDSAIRAARSANRHDLVIRLLFDLARAHGRADGATEAIALALDVERRLTDRELVDRTLELQVLNFLANMFIVSGDFVSADLRAQRAQALAEDTSDPLALAELYAGLTVARQDAGDLEAALLYARKAIAAYEHLGNQRELAALWNNLAWLYVKRKQLARADEAAVTAARLAEATHHEPLQALVVATQAEIALARGRHVQSIRLAESAAGDPRASEWTRANSLWLKAQAIAATKAPPAKVRAAFDAALSAFASQPAGWRARVHESYAETLEARGAHRDASVQFQKALRLLRPAIR